MPPRGLFISNGCFSRRLAGGDFHFLRLARALEQRGHSLTLLGGHALAFRMEQFGLQSELRLTDDAMRDLADDDRLGILRDYAAKARRTRQALSGAPEFDYAYATSDLWADMIPLFACQARKKAFILHMQAPTLLECLRPGPLFPGERRLASLHYALSQRYTTRRARHRGIDHVFMIRPAFAKQLLRLGFREEDCSWMPVGYDCAEIDAAPQRDPEVDVVWVGRVHPQKGIEDLVNVLRILRDRVQGFRALLIGDLESALGSRLSASGLAEHVRLAGYLSGPEKFAALKSSRLFLLPSHHEGAPAVAGEAILCGVPVAAYALPALDEMPASLVSRAPCFDVARLAELARERIEASRAGRWRAPAEDVCRFRADNDLDAAVQAFVRFVERD